MIDLTGVKHHPALTEMVDVLCNKTQNTDRGFFQVEAAYFLSKMASNMRASIVTKDRGEIPVNTYALALATSGFGKGYSVSIVEEEFMKGFKRRFLDETMPTVAEDNLWKIANDRAARDGTDQQAEFDKVSIEYKAVGSFLYTFDEASSPAVKQMRKKLLMAGCGAVSLQIDEVGLNLAKSTEGLILFLELFDQGRVKPKLTKESKDNSRGEDLDGKTPTNMLMFGTPSKLLDGGPTEDLFYSLLDTGYARRCLFGWGGLSDRAYLTSTPEEIYNSLTSTKNDAAIKKWSNYFHGLADPVCYGWKMTVEDEVGIKLIEYKIACERAAEGMKDHEEIRKAEISHRYFKALKLAGAYAFVDGSNEIEMEQLLSAILLVEESGASFQTILTRERTYVKLARYMADSDNEVTHTDLLEDLSFYPKSNVARQDMMNLATAWGYKQHIIIKKSFVDGIEFFKGETLTKTDLNEMVVSYSDHWAYNYLAEKVPFDQLHLLTQAPGMHWTNHHFKKGDIGQGHRAEENILTGFNLVVIDVDEGISLDAAHELLKDYKFFTYTTKRSTEDANRFRLIFPINYYLELDSAEYKEFMSLIFEWLPFKTDESSEKREKKWECFEGGQYHYNDGELLDALPFIPKTSRNEQYIQENRKLQSHDNLERWFAQRIASGNRNNHMIKYALALVDSGMSMIEVNQQVHAFNKKLNTPLSEDELDTTVMVTVGKRFHRAQAA